MKPLAEVLAKAFTQLFNASLDEDRHNSGRLTSTVMPVHKSRDRDKCSTHRQVSMTSTALKSPKRVLRDGVVNQLGANKLMLAEQHGFWHKLSCLTSLISLQGKETGRNDTE